MRRPAALLTAGLLCCAVASAATAQDRGFDLAQALVDAGPGETIVVPPGTYPGPLSIDTSVTLIGEDWPVIQGTGDGDVITVSAPDVTLRGLVIRGSGDRLENEDAGVTGLGERLIVEGNRIEDVLFGVYLKQAPGSVIRDNVIRGMELPVPRRGDGIRVWYSSGTLVEGNDVADARDVVIWFSPDVEIRGNTVERGRYGVHTMFSDNQLVEENVLRHNSVGAFLMYGRVLTMRNNLMYDNRGPTGYGVGLKDVDDVVAQGNRFVGNRVGVYVDNSPRERAATVAFDHNLIAYNDIGMILQPLVKRNTYTQNVFLDNGEQIAIAGGGQLKENNWWLDGVGNYWSDYAGFDADGGGIGDIPYASTSLYETLLGEYPKLRLFQLGPATDALDLAAEAFPVFQPPPKMVDEHPLMAVPALPPVPGLPQPQRAGSLVASLALIALAAIILYLGAGSAWRPSTPLDTVPAADLTDSG